MSGSFYIAKLGAENESKEFFQFTIIFFCVCALHRLSIVNQRQLDFADYDFE